MSWYNNAKMWFRTGNRTGIVFRTGTRTGMVFRTGISTGTVLRIETGPEPEPVTFSAVRTGPEPEPAGSEPDRNRNRSQVTQVHRNRTAGSG